ncbi:MAG TPA: ATP-binding protein [Anaerolineaceae bacterium]|jgi:serine/threonine-protein kinase RsbW
MDTVIVPGRFENLEKISKFVKDVSWSAGFDEMGIYAIQTAVDEACSNIIDHAYGGESSEVIELNCINTKNALKIILRDHGKPFIPESIPIPVKHTRLKDIKEGGLGLYFMHQLMDEVYFEFSPGIGNTLTMIKHKPG